MLSKFESLFVTKLNNIKFAQQILKFESEFKSEIARLVDYRDHGIKSTAWLIDRTNEAVHQYDNLIINAFNELNVEERIRIISEFKMFNDLAEKGIFADSDILLSAARIVR